MYPGVQRGKEIACSLTDEHVAHIARDALTHGGETFRPLATAGAGPSTFTAGAGV
jgi:hypothetical protein